jgi:dTMP kinase
LFFDLAVDEAKRRRMAATTAPDRFERENLDFFARVRAVYLARAARYPQRIRLIDAGQTVEDIRKLLEEIIVTACQ